MSANTPQTAEQRYGQTADLHLLDEIVTAFIKRHYITASDLVEDIGGIPTVATRGWDGPIEQLALEKVRMLSPTTLGRIIYAIPDAALYYVHSSTWLGKYESGPYLLQQIAASAIVCRVWAILDVDRGTTLYSPKQMGPVAA